MNIQSLDRFADVVRNIQDNLKLFGLEAALIRNSNLQTISVRIYRNQKTVAEGNWYVSEGNDREFDSYRPGVLQMALDAIVKVRTGEQNEKIDGNQGLKDWKHTFSTVGPIAELLEFRKNQGAENRHIAEAIDELRARVVRLDNRLSRDVKAANTRINGLEYKTLGMHQIGEMPAAAPLTEGLPPPSQETVFRPMHPVDEKRFCGVTDRIQNSINTLHSRIKSLESQSNPAAFYANLHDQNAPVVGSYFEEARRRKEMTEIGFRLNALSDRIAELEADK